MSMIMVIFSATAFAGNANFEKLISDYKSNEIYKSMDASLEFGIKNLEGLSITAEEEEVVKDLLLNTGLKFNVKYDIDTMKYYGNMYLTRSGDPLWTLEFYYDDALKIFGVNSPLMYEKWIVLDKNGIEKYFGQDIGATFKLAMEEMKTAQTMDMNSLSEETMNEITGIFVNAINNWVGEETKTSFLSNNGTSVDLSSYNMKFDMMNVIEVVEQYNTFLKTNKEVRDMLIDSIVEENNMQVDYGILDETSRISEETAERIKAMEDPEYFDKLFSQYDVSQTIDEATLAELKDVIKFDLNLGFDANAVLRKYDGTISYHFPKEMIEEEKDFDMDLYFNMVVDRINEPIEMPEILKDYYNVSYLSAEELEAFTNEVQSNLMRNVMFDEEGSKIIESINYLSEQMN